MDSQISQIEKPTIFSSFGLSKKTYIILSVSVALFIILALMPLVHGQTNSTTYTPPANQNAFPASAVPQWLDTGSNAWMLTAGTLVGLQSLPGLAVFYGGLAKKKYAVNTMLMILYGFAAVLVVFMLS